MAVARHATSTITRLHGITHTSPYNMADERHPAHTTINNIHIRHDRTWPPSVVLHSQLPIYTTSPYKMADTPTYITLRHHKQHGRRAKHIPNYHFTRHHDTIWPPRDTLHPQYNMAAERHPTFTITNIHGVTHAAAAYTYVITQHGRHTNSTNLHNKNFQLSTHSHTVFFRVEWIQLATHHEWIQLATIVTTITSSPGP
jgi:hypothetical protein